MKADSENHLPHQPDIESFETEIAPLPTSHPEHLTKHPILWTEIVVIVTIIAAPVLAVAINIAQTPQIT